MHDKKKKLHITDYYYYYYYRLCETCIRVLSAIRERSCQSRLRDKRVFSLFFFLPFRVTHATLGISPEKMRLYVVFLRFFFIRIICAFLFLKIFTLPDAHPRIIIEPAALPRMDVVLSFFGFTQKP